LEVPVIYIEQEEPNVLVYNNKNYER